MPTKSKLNKDMPKRKVAPIRIRDASILYRNFSGKAKQFNAAGLRNFNVIIDNDTAAILERDGWNIKWDEPREEGDPRRARLKVAVRFDNFPPKVYLLTANGKTVLDEDTIGVLDDAEIDKVDMLITASTGIMDDGKEYVKAYLSKMAVTLSPDDFEYDYIEVSPNRRAVDSDDD